MNDEVSRLKGALSNILFEEGEVEAEIDGDRVNLFADDELLVKGIRIRARAKLAWPRYGNLSLDVDRREAWVNPGRKKDVKLELTKAEFKILLIILCNQSKAAQIIDLTENLETTEDAVSTHIGNLRRKLREAGSSVEITIVHGEVYRLDSKVA